MPGSSASTNRPNGHPLPRTRLNYLHLSSGPRVASVSFLLLLCACQSSKPKDEATNASSTSAQTAAGKPVPYDPHVWDKGAPDALGAFLAELDKSMRAWTNLTLTAQTRTDRTKASMLQQDLMRRVHARQQELIDALESGPPRNRAIAAGALGFTASRDVQGPLLVALTDKENEVVQNAALSLALLDQSDTPLLPLLEVLQSNVNGQARANAAYAVRTILEAGATPSEDVIKGARRGLLDIEPFAQAQCALILALAKDEESIPDLTEMLAGDSALVVRAAIQALLTMGRSEPKLMGKSARS